ncbi:MAG: transglycosylase domain-containing protein [Solirubrobacterales bacterium]
MSPSDGEPSESADRGPASPSDEDPAAGSRSRARSRGRGGEDANGGSIFDPSKPSPSELREGRKLRSGRSRKVEQGPGGSKASRPKLVRADDTPDTANKLRGEDSQAPVADAATPGLAASLTEPSTAGKAPPLADEDLLDSAFEKPMDEPGDFSKSHAAPAFGRPRSLDGDADSGTPKPRGAQRSLGGVTLPEMSGLADRLRALVPERRPEVGRPRRADRPVLGGAAAGSGRFGGIRLPFDLPLGLGGGDDGPRKKGRIKKLRLGVILLGLALLALVSTFFGMMMAVSSDLPDLENRTEFKASENSVVYDVTGRKLGTLTNNNNRILVESPDIAQTMKQAAVAIEDRRFYEHSGVDIRGILRAAVADVIPGGSTQGASTITQQFVKNALQAQASRTVFEKFREAALAYHLEKQWDKDKILTQYLNTIYYGEGAYGVEAAARTYFAWNHPDCGTDGHPQCASVLYPEEAALLAGIISSPSAFSPRENPESALNRRNLVLDKEVEQGDLTPAEAEEAKAKSLPSPSQIQTPSEDSLSPYFTTWLRQILVDKYGAGRAFGGGLRIKTTLDYDLQTAAEEAVQNTLGGVTPTSSIVVIDNKTGGIKAMVGGPDYQEQPFNIATNGHRQPGSSWKPFTLITALENGHSPGETYSSQPKIFTVPNSGGKEFFKVHNYDDKYLGSASIATATTYSDNSVYADLGLHIVKSPQQSLDKIAATAQSMGVTTPVSTNPAMILGGLRKGVTPLELAYAYSTLADNGERTSGSLAAYKGGPVPILDIRNQNGDEIQANKTKHTRVIPQTVAETAKSILATVVSSGTGRRAQIGEPQWGKTGTTENNGDAWFCGATDKVTACVWVGHADSTKSMDTEFGGLPVDGGTFPAEIWAQVVSAYYRIQAEHDAESGSTSSDSSDSSSGYVPPSTSVSPSGSGSDSGGGSTGGGGGGGAPKPAAPAPAAPAPAAPASGGGVGAGL